MQLALIFTNITSTKFTYPDCLVLTVGNFTSSCSLHLECSTTHGLNLKTPKSQLQHSHMSSISPLMNVVVLRRRIPPMLMDFSIPIKSTISLKARSTTMSRPSFCCCCDVDVMSFFFLPSLQTMPAMSLIPNMASCPLCTAITFIAIAFLDAMDSLGIIWKWTHGMNVKKIVHILILSVNVHFWEKIVPLRM